MDKFDVTIIGGGSAGLSCALLIASADGTVPNCENKNILVLDTGHSDAHRAKFNNVAGIPFGTNGTKALENTIKQIENYSQISYKIATARELSKVKNNFLVDYFDRKSKQSLQIKSEYLVLASGFRSFNLKGLNIETVQFHRSKNNTRVMIKHNDYKVAPKLFVCGLLAGVSSQWNIAAGSGSQVGVHIISEWSGDWSVVHDKI